MSARHEHVEPRNIAGSSLPDFMRPNHSAIIGIAYCLAAVALVALVSFAVWLIS